MAGVGLPAGASVPPARRWPAAPYAPPHCLLLRRRPLRGLLCPLRRQPSLLPRGTCSACRLASTLRDGKEKCPEFFDPPTPLRSCTARAVWRGGCAGRSAAKIPLTCRLVVVLSWQCTVMSPTWGVLIATCSQCSERGANHQGMAHPYTPQTPHKRAPFWGVPKSVPKKGEKKVSKKVSRMGELLNTPFFVHNFVPRGPIFGPPGGDPPFLGAKNRNRSGSGAQKGGFLGVRKSPPPGPGRPGRPPGISPPPPRAPPRGPPPGPPSGTPPGTPP